MATTTPNLHSFSSSTCSYPSFSLSNSSSFTFQIPRKPLQISCFHSKATIFAHPIEFSQLGSGFSNVGLSGFDSNHKTSSFYGKPGLGRDLTIVQATEVVAPTSEDQVDSKPKTSKKKKKIKYPRRVLDQYQVLQFPIITEAAVKNIADENTLLFTVDVRADKQMIKDAVTNLFGVKVRKVNTAIRPDGTKKAHIMLGKDFNASDLAKKIGIFPSGD